MPFYKESMKAKWQSSTNRVEKLKIKSQKLVDKVDQGEESDDEGDDND